MSSIKFPQPNSHICPSYDGFNFACYTFSAPNPQRLNTTIAKIDYNLTKSGSHRLFVRGNYQTDRRLSAAAIPRPAAGQHDS